MIVFYEKCGLKDARKEVAWKLKQSVSSEPARWETE